MAFCNHGPSCWFTARFSFEHARRCRTLRRRSTTARITLKLTAAPHRDTCLPTTKDHAFLPYHSPATSHSAAPRLNATRLLHSIPIGLIAVSSN
jgi:hypothetical protein